ncbi:type IV secretion system protein [Stenotrophomonas lacuserhaii]|uniref:type IV secretion system protein n=1 Tax=Stenotrophomonas lacuserhaii TaxID=2760084 RepID=UPI0032EE9D9C
MDSMWAQGALHGPIATSSIGDFVFFKLIFDYLSREISEFGLGFLSRMMEWVGIIALVVMTIWLLLQGYRIVTGRSRDSMMALVTDMARAALIVITATTMAIFGQNVHSFLTHYVQDEITYVVTGEEDTAKDLIDENLAYMQVALSAVDVLDVAGDVTLDNAKTRAMWFIGLGTGGPAVTAGAMLLLYEVAMALFIGFAPLFILCLLFEQTKSLFQRWLFYGIGTMFSMAVLAAMTGIAMSMVSKVAFAFWGTAAAGALMGSNFTEGMTSMALQQGGMGLILTTLILTAPPMAAMFFQGTLGAFMAYSQIGGSPGAAAPGPQGQPPGSYAPQQAGNPAPAQAPSYVADARQTTMTPSFGQGESPASNVPSPGSRGNAPTSG